MLRGGRFPPEGSIPLREPPKHLDVLEMATAD
eukprot:SAG31_NODE_24693_length_476_cov_0.957560_1_plen_31_part_01